MEILYCIKMIDVEFMIVLYLWKSIDQFLFNHTANVKNIDVPKVGHGWAGPNHQMPASSDRFFTISTAHRLCLISIRSNDLTPTHRQNPGRITSQE